MVENRLIIRARVTAYPERDVIRWGIVFVALLEVAVALKLGLGNTDTTEQRIIALCLMGLMPFGVPLFVYLNRRDAVHKLLRMDGAGVAFASVSRLRRERSRLGWGDITHIVRMASAISMLSNSASILLHRDEYSREQWAAIEDILRSVGVGESRSSVDARVAPPLIVRRSEKQAKERRNGGILFLGLFGALGLVFLVVMMFVPTPPGSEKWQAFVLAALWFALIGVMASLVALTPLPHHIRVDSVALTMTTRPRRAIRRIPWQDVERVKLQWGHVELATSDRKVRLYFNQFPPADWQHLRESIRANLADRFDFSTLTPGEAMRERVRAMSFSRRFVRFSILTAAGVLITLACFLIPFYLIDDTKPWARDVSKWFVMGPMLLMILGTLLYARRFSFWRERRRTV